MVFITGETGMAGNQENSFIDWLGSPIKCCGRIRSSGEVPINVYRLHRNHYPDYRL
jgi:hypothetical protein